jgi:hypothetical protein
LDRRLLALSIIHSTNVSDDKFMEGVAVDLEEYGTHDLRRKDAKYAQEE